MAMYSLGTFIFESNSILPKSTKRDTTYDWKAVSRLGREPAQQAIGLGTDTQTLQGVLYPSSVKKGTAAHVSELRTQGANMKPLLMIDGTGYVYGKWCIKKVSEGRTHLWPNSSPRKIEFTVELVSYGSDRV